MNIATARRLLVLDDEPTVGEILCFVAETMGFEARLCGNAAEFLHTLADWPPSHVAVDLTLPDMSGEQVVAELAQRRCTARLLVVSGLGAAELDRVLSQARRLGLSVAGALPKPFQLAALRALLSDDWNIRQQAETRD